jgi:lysyl endopeptidase
MLLVCAAGVAQAAAPFKPDLATLHAVPRVELPAAAVQKALAEPIKGTPYQFAVPVDLVLAPRQGRWTTRDGVASWRLRLRSPGAKSLSLQLADPGLPEGAELWVYDPRGQLVHGPFDAGRLAPSGLWMPMVSGEELVLELTAPAARAGALRLGTARAFHGFRDGIRESAAETCNVDITCPQAAAWAEDAGSVARISIGGTFVCSGELLNNARQDGRRLFITADHCGVDAASGPADSVMFYFNYTGSCGNDVVDPLPPPTFMGAQRLANDVHTDFSLLLITDPAPLPAGVYFAGWDARGLDPPAGGAAIHHPGGDEKKIALHNMLPTRTSVDIGSGCAIPAWQVNWSEGTTQPGSSGSGLWDTSHRVIGILSGGFASCRSPLLPDYFARLDRAWTAQPEAGGQLRAHLDPDGTCVAVVPGLDPDTDPPPGPVAPTVDNMKCSGGQSTCDGSRKSSGGALAPLALALLALAARRRLQHHEQHARDRHR